MARTIDAPPVMGNAEANAEAEEARERELARQAKERAAEFARETAAETGVSLDESEFLTAADADTGMERRPEHVQGLPDLRPKMPSIADEKAKMRFLLEKQKKFTVTLRQNPPQFDQLPDWLGGINGYQYRIKRDEIVEVPESIYLILVQQREVVAQRTADKSYIDKPAAYPLVSHGRISDQVKAGLITGENIV